MTKSAAAVAFKVGWIRRLDARSMPWRGRIMIDRVQNQYHGAGKGIPFRSLRRELSAPGRRQAIEPGPLALRRELPAGSDPALRLKTMERRIQRSGLDLEQIFRSPLDVLGNRMAVSRSFKQGVEDEQVERALQQLNAGRSAAIHYVDILRYFCVECLLA